MKALFSSDLHGHESAFQAFAHELSQPDYDLGILGGDLVDEWLPEERVLDLTGASPDDLLDDLVAEGQNPAQTWEASSARALIDRALEAQIAQFQSLLEGAGKPVLFVLGNHDRIEWPETGLCTNLHLRRLEVGAWNFVGYRWTDTERTQEEMDEDFAILQRLSDSRTILVSHAPPAGIHPRWETPYGLPILSALRLPPWLHLFGHVHSLFGNLGRYVNGSWPESRQFLAVDLGTRRVRRVEATP